MGKISEKWYTYQPKLLPQGVPCAKDEFERIIDELRQSGVRKFSASKKITESNKMKTVYIEIDQLTTPESCLTAKKKFDDFNYEIDEENRKWREKVRDTAKEQVKNAMNIVGPNSRINNSLERTIAIKEKMDLAEKDAKNVLSNTSANVIQTGMTEEEKDNINSTLSSLKSLKEERNIGNKITLSQIIASPDVVSNISKGSGSTFLLVGSSKSGKTTCMVQFATIWKKFFPNTICILLSATYKADGGAYSSITSCYGDDCIVTEHIDEAINLVEKLQKSSSAKFPILFLLDDIVDKKNNKYILKLFTTLRNLNISTVMASQTCMLFNKSNRSNVNYLIAGKLNNSESVKDCYEKFLKGLWSDNDSYQEQYKKDTANYGKIFVDLLNDKISYL